MAGRGFKSKLGLTPEAMSEMPASIETLPEKCTGTCTGVVREGFLEAVVPGGSMGSSEA